MKTYLIALLFLVVLPGCGDYVSSHDGVSDDYVPVEFSFAAPPVPAWTPSTMGIYAELTWNGAASDLDLHLVSETEGGVLDEPPYDCYYANTAPNWGSTTATTDDPRLATGDVDGFGPETIVFTNPSAGAYRVYAKLYDEGGAGAQIARLKLWIDTVVMVDTTALLPMTGSVWNVAVIEYPTKTVTVEGTVTP